MAGRARATQDGPSERGDGLLIEIRRATARLAAAGAELTARAGCALAERRALLERRRAAVEARRREIDAHRALLEKVQRVAADGRVPEAPPRRPHYRSCSQPSTTA